MQEKAQEAAEQAALLKSTEAAAESKVASGDEACQAKLLAEVERYRVGYLPAFLP